MAHFALQIRLPMPFSSSPVPTLVLFASLAPLEESKSRPAACQPSHHAVGREGGRRSPVQAVRPSVRRFGFVAAVGHENSDPQSAFLHAASDAAATAAKCTCGPSTCDVRKSFRFWAPLLLFTVTLTQPIYTIDYFWGVAPSPPHSGQQQSPSPSHL